MAAVLACGPGAVLSHASAAALHGLRSVAGAKVDVTIRRSSSLMHAGIRVHKRLELTAADITEVDGIPVTSVARTLLDLAGTGTVTRLERACEQAVIREVFDMRAISELLRRSKGRPGVRRLREVLARGDLEDGAPASGLERRYRALCRDAGLPKPELNRWILLGDEYHKVDFLWRRERAVIEVDGRRYHSTGWVRNRDARRDRLLDAAGWSHGRISEDEIAEDPDRAVNTARILLSPGRA